MSSQDWIHVNQAAVAKCIREMVYEETLKAELVSEGSYIIDTPNGQYQFKARPGVWGDLRVEVGTILKNKTLVQNANDFIIDTQSFTQMDDIILANFLEEMNNSLVSDLKIHNKALKADVVQLLEGETEDLQHYSLGHPKIINAKGRLGWGTLDHINYAPENEVPLQLLWLAVDKDFTTSAVHSALDWMGIYLESFREEDLKSLLHDNNIDLEKYLLLPVHPWQWDRYIYLQFQNEIQNKIIINLGPAGDFYQPQISLRTFNNVSRPGQCDIKLPLSIANTSSVRGIPARYIEQGPDLSADFAEICKQDGLLLERNVKILKEVAGISFVHPEFKKIKAAPYRYHELLGAIWRLSPVAVREENNKSLMVGVLLNHSSTGILACDLIQKSGLPVQEWIRRYTQTVIVPLYHLQLKYGIGLVAHGQNIVLELENFKPAGLILKDFQGDLRLTDTSKALKQKLTRLPAHYLIHDLITGHFVTFLRYLSGGLEDAGLLSEREFYRVMSEEITLYLQQESQLRDSEVFSSINILSPELPKVLINAVRYKVGYSDSSERPLPMLGTNIKNPLAFHQE